MARRLTQAESTLATAVFGHAIKLEAVRLHGGGFGPFAVTVGSNIFLPPSLSEANFARADLHAQALLVHELVHVWQFQTRPLWTLTSWAKTMLGGGYGAGLPGYRYDLPLGGFHHLNLEQQASVVEHGFLLRAKRRSSRMPWGLSATHLAAAPFPI